MTRRILLLALLVALIAAGSVRAAEREQLRRLNQWRITNPCFDDTGKWYTR